jgi:cell wall-associated NlpC family hydrolase
LFRAGLAGIAAPRDSDQQRTLGREVPEGVPLARGDLILFAGHVGMMADGTRLIHANAFHMMVTVEPLDDVVARLADTHERPILCRRRIDP